MSYLALARQWRPRTFSQLIGQDHVRQALINALNQQRLHHAYLFTGTRGVGKTSVARLLAKSLNCEQGITSNPCLQCTACTDIEQGCFVDLIEIDAASKTRVEDTRELLENVQYAANNGRFKIYLIDEVHMLSQHSFNALLKTLEEPPNHVKFLLATTDPQKLPLTVLSRCLQFNLKHIESDTICRQLRFILNEEKREFEEEALMIVAKAAQGSMRDALSILDQALISTDGLLTTTEIKSILGYTKQDFALQLLKSLINHDGGNVVQLSRQIAAEGSHFSYVLDEIINYLHQITLYHALPSESLLLTSTLTPMTEVQEIARQLSAEDTQLFYQIALKGAQDIFLAPTLALGFEMTLLRMLAFRPVSYKPSEQAATVQAKYIAQEAQIEEQIKNMPSVTQVEEQMKYILPVLQPEKQINKRAIVSEPHKIEAYINSHASSNIELLKQESPLIFPQKSADWQELLPKLGLTGMTRTAAENVVSVTKQDNHFTLEILTGHQSLFTPTIIKRIEQALSTHCHQNIKLILSSNHSEQSSYAKKQSEQKLQQEKAHKNLKEDPFLQEIEQKFSAEIIKSSISCQEDDL